MDDPLLLMLAIGALILAVLGAIASFFHSRRRERDRQRRAVRNIAYERAWHSIFVRGRQRRITYQPRDESE